MNYLSSFVSKFLAVFAKFFVLTCGTIFAVLVILTIYDEDVINIEHLLTIISVTGAVAGIARSLIPDEVQAKNIKLPKIQLLLFRILFFLRIK